jgi:hypothetical protein
MNKRREDADVALRHLRDVRERRARGEQAELGDSSDEDELCNDEASGETQPSDNDDFFLWDSQTQLSDDDDDFVTPAEGKRRRVEKAEAVGQDQVQDGTTASVNLAPQRSIYVPRVSLEDQQHPGVSECSVVAVPHPTLLEEVGVAVYPRKGFERRTLGDLLGATQSLAPFKRPAHLFLYSEPLPRGATGKLLKKQVKEDIKSGKVKKAPSGAGAKL